MTADLARRVLAVLVLVAGVMAGPVLCAQAGVAVTGVPVQPSAANEWGGAFIWAFLSSSALEWLKRNERFTLFAETATFYAQRVLGIVLATAAAVGVHYTYDAQSGVLTITGLTAAGIWTIGVESLRQWCLQEVVYRTAIKNYGREK